MFSSGSVLWQCYLLPDSSRVGAEATVRSLAESSATRVYQTLSECCATFLDVEYCPPALLIEFLSFAIKLPKAMLQPAVWRMPGLFV